MAARHRLGAGRKKFELPPEAGFAEEAGATHWAVQNHYNNTQGLVGEVDETGYDEARVLHPARAHRNGVG